MHSTCYGTKTKRIVNNIEIKSSYLEQNCIWITVLQQNTRDWARSMGRNCDKYVTVNAAVASYLQPAVVESCLPLQQSSAGVI